MTWPIPDGAGAVGPTGPTGPTGATGPTGPAGSANITGTANKVVKFTSTTAGGDSSITDDGTDVTITEATTTSFEDARTQIDEQLAGQVCVGHGRGEPTTPQLEGHLEDDVTA